LSSQSTKKKEVKNMNKITEMLKGVLEGCVLEIISRGETYGYEITQQLRALGFSDIVEGTVYTITMRLEKNKLVDIEKKSSTMGPPRKFYRLNEAGQQELENFWAKWNFVSSKLKRIKRKIKEEKKHEYFRKDLWRF
jgi:DNA-binding PadR family transcriptional regulator